jgi:hypothetical protein
MATPQNEPGTYWGQLVKGVSSYSKNRNSPQIVLQFNVTDRSADDKWESLPSPFEQRVYLSMYGDAVKYTCDKLKSLDFNGNFDAPEFGKDGAELVCIHTTYKGEPTEQWDLAGFGGGGEIKPADEGTCTKLGALYRAHTQASPAPLGKPKAPPEKPPF